MKTQLLQAMGSFVLGGSVVLGSLYSWLGTSDLESIKSLVENHMTDTEQQVSAFVQDYQVQVDSANAEIGEYKDALAQANSNIDKLITAYEEEQAQAEQDLADLQQALADMESRLDSQYETDMNAIIEQANEQINNANIEVAETKEYIEESLLPSSQVDEYIQRAKDYDKVDTTGDKSVHDISSIVPSEQPQE